MTMEKENTSNENLKEKLQTYQDLKEQYFRQKEQLYTILIDKL